MSRTIWWTKAADAVVEVFDRELHHDALAQIVSDVEAQLRSDNTGRIIFDWSSVEELVGPWGVHFAILIDLADRTGLEVSLRGLRDQPLQLARLFRDTPQVRSLLDQSNPIPSAGRRVA